MAERIQGDPRTAGYSVAIPPLRDDVRSGVEEIERMAARTASSRLVVLDVRSQTLPRLQKAYNTVVGLNRRDINYRCFTVLIGDGPLGLFQPGRTLEVFVPHLAKMRNDYWAAAYFFDPFLHYTPDERPHLGLDHVGQVRHEVPQRLEGAFREEQLDVEQIRRYFRAGNVPPAEREVTKQRRLGKLLKLYRKRLLEAFGDRAPNLESLLTREGFDVGGDTLRLHLYPTHFEDWVHDLVQQAAQMSNRMVL